MAVELLRPRLFQPICHQCKRASLGQSMFSRSFQTSARKAADDSKGSSRKTSTTEPVGQAASSAEPPTIRNENRSSRSAFKGSFDSSALDRLFDQISEVQKAKPRPAPALFDYDKSFLNPSVRQASAPEEPYHFHVYAHKHNTHITLTNPKRNTVMTASTGNIGFRKGNRGSYDAAYQLAAYVMGRIHEQGLLREINSMEVILRGFGAGREAVVKALMGTEGRNLRPKVVRLTDATRLKFGGTRSPKPRRLG